MMPELAEFFPLIPEIFILSMTCIILILDAFLTERTRTISFALSQVTLVITALLVVFVDSGITEVVLHGLFVNDAMAIVLKVFVCIVTFMVFQYSRDYLRARGLFKGEYYVLGLFGVLGMMIMISAHNFLTIYLGLELLSLSLYAMVAFDRDSATASEAAMKYFVLGALASGMLLYGISMLYGVTGSLDIAEVSNAIAAHDARDLPLVFGLVFVVVGLAFKLGAVPFHMWVPDVYQGAPTSVTLYIGSAPKLAAFAIVMRLLVDAMGPLYVDWSGMLMILAVLSMAVGNVIAIAQTNIKRMLAYSTISHIGFLILGILSGSNEGYAASMFYAITYAIMAAGGFGIIILLSRRGFEADQLDDFKGLNDRSPWAAFMMMLLMFSMAGVPPTVGFFAKLSVLEAVISADMLWLALVAVAFSVIGAFYYLRIIKLMYFDKVEEGAQPIQAAFDTRFVLSLNSLAVLALGIFPGALMTLCINAIG
ncbi:MAG: NADH-quinone oxidoreductase subunit NuoN [Gammaproteobacteria bacterium]|nr:NADH-quinone oxidoreductase subunit NuoN [Gammaproteobacteria bacterium]